ncbi:MAG: D-Ala-D-Ala carboxypeptidase family metallohydrolase [Synergistetes bacterium]|nr:D-Ala-D-Ala carboxypeptidase family metallohydrolase [Synergistota bacterium]MDW8192354.1 D-Ala-D-Ala carboxypeptidase family metallohydrolase [Synergistota bacterium]
MNKVKISFHFYLNEFECPCCGTVKIDEILLQRLEALRILWGMPLRVTSGFRCEKHNKEVGGVDNSLHMQGRAVDLAVKEEDQGKFLTLAKLIGLRVIPYPKRGFVHLDLGGDEVGRLSGSIKPGVSDSVELLSFNPS